MVDPAKLTEDSTLREVYESLNEIQKKAVDYLVSEAVKQGRRRTR